MGEGCCADALYANSPDGEPRWKLPPPCSTTPSMRSTGTEQAARAVSACHERGPAARCDGAPAAGSSGRCDAASSGAKGLWAQGFAFVPLVLAASFVALPAALPAQGIPTDAAHRRARSSAWPELPPGRVCPPTAASLPGRGNFLSIRKFSPVGPLAGCSAQWNDELHRHFFRGSPPSLRGIECLGTSFGVTHMIDLRRADEILMDSRDGGFRSEEAALADFNRSHPDRPIRYFNVRTTRETPDENQRQIENVVRYVQQALSEDPAAVFYLHCRAGRDRTGVMIAAIESVVGECPWPEVRAELFAYRFDRSYVRPLLRPLQRAIGLNTSISR